MVVERHVDKDLRGNMTGEGPDTGKKRYRERYAGYIGEVRYDLDRGLALTPIQRKKPL